MPYMLPLLNMQEAPPPTQSKKSSKPQQMMRTVSISILVMSLPVLYVSFLHVPPAALFRDTTFWFLMSNSIIIVIAADSGMLFFGSSSSSRSCSSVDVVVGSDGDGLPSVISGGGPTAAVKENGHVVSVADEVVVNHHQVMVLREQEDAVTTMMVAAENDHAYALVLREEDQGELRVPTEPAVPESRDIMVVAPPSLDLAGAALPVWKNEAGAMVRAKTTGLRREERLRRRHSHRPSSHSRALVPVQDRSVVVREEKQQQQQLRRSPALEDKDMSEYSRLSDEELNRRVEEFITKFNREMRLQLEREQLALAAA